MLAAIWDWNWFRGPVASFASGRMHRQVTIAGDLRVHLWSWQPSATVDGVHVANPAWVQSGAQSGKVAGPNLAEIDRIAVQIRLLPLFGGHLDLRLLEFDRPRVALYRDGQGRATWDFSDGAEPDKPLRMPPIRKFVIDGGQVNYRDERRKLTFKGQIDAKENLGAANRGFQMTGEGALNAQPFHLLVTGGPLLNIDRDKPYPFDADIRAGQTYVTAKGAVPKPFDMASFYMDVTGRGPDLADLYGLTGVPLPNTPPYNLHARLSRDVHLWKLQDIGGKVGSSDLAGVISVRTGEKRPFVQADLRSKSLDFPDLGALFGGTRRPGAVASPQQKAAAQTLRAQQRIFPDATLAVDKIRALDADVSYKADSIRDAPINLRSGSVQVKLEDGVLRANPLEFDLPQGTVSGFVNLDARKAVPVTDLDLRLANARLQTFIPAHAQGGDPISGSVVGRVKLHGAGASIHRALAASNGEMEIVAPSGEVRRAFAELAGVDLVKGLGLLWAKNQDSTPLRCGFAHFNAKDGVLTSDALVVDTGPVLVNGSGTINLGSEQLDLTVKGHPKKFQLVRLNVPVTISGPLLGPKVTVHKSGALAQGGAAIALGALLSPAAILLPFVDAGLAKDANCASLLSEGKSEGAPVKSQAIAQQQVAQAQKAAKPVR
ncbi:MAG: AsmA family protein [Phenylobacterium sp.]|nr:MAG: AsmA family protein [Phenylobacterium sp.]